MWSKAKKSKMFDSHRLGGFQGKFGVFEGLTKLLNKPQQYACFDNIWRCEFTHYVNFLLTYHYQLEIAKKCGADHVLNPRRCDLQKEIVKLCGRFGCDVYMEVTGNPASVHQGLKCLAPMGRFICYSVFKDTFPADWSLIGNEIELRSLCITTREIL